ncbi:MAG: DUF1858 domain-containing protein [Pseudomonadota bacterium]
MSDAAVPITLEESVEDIVARFPRASGFLLERGVVCIKCGEPAWCSLGELIAEKQLDGARIVAELNSFLGV